ncbi:MAG: septum formation protein Maf [Desulfovibrionaceae bacterium]|nr:septum formation protein Maf [Desulfovibrionaceae bacterium]
MQSPFEQIRPLVLASSSPRRQNFLRDQGLEFTVMAAEGPEPVPDGREDPTAFALRAAGHKARSAARRLASGAGAAGAAPLVLAADTIVTLNGQILGKPASRQQALSMLTRLAGVTHTVITACCLHPVNPADARPLCFADSTRVSFADWPEEILRAYVDTGDPLDKAGAYGIQGKGAFLAERIEGSWSTVVGLPVSQTIRALLTMNALRPRSAA